MFETVNRLLEKYVGGQIFFTELDNAVKFNIDILGQVVQKAMELHPTAITIASGEIGLAMHNLGVRVGYLVPGGLRHTPEKINLAPFADKIKGNKFVFIDDSYFSGRTALVVKEEIERLGGIFVGSVVAYDGSKEKDTSVDALYRYYNHYDVLGRPLRKENT